MDASHDNSKITLRKIAEATNMPEYVKNGHILSKEAAADTNPRLFADPINRRYPINDKANTWLSAAYFAKTAEAKDGYSPAVYKSVSDRIFKAAAYYGITKDVADAILKVTGHDDATLKKQAALRSDPADDPANYCDPENLGYPVFGKEDCKMANDHFSRYAHMYGWQKRHEIAQNIMRKSAEYGVQPSPTVRMSAWSGAPRRDALMEGILYRADDMARAGAYDGAVKMASLCEEVGGCKSDELMSKLDDIMEIMASFDELNGLDDRYGKNLRMPEEIVFDIPEDEMCDFAEDAIPLGGHTFSARALSGLPKSLFESILPHDMFEGMLDGGKLSPKKMSITIVKMDRAPKRQLLSAIKRYTDGGEEPLEIDISGDAVDDVEEDLDKKPEKKETPEEPKESDDAGGKDESDSDDGEE